jgi:hypothetical protein
MMVLHISKGGGVWAIERGLGFSLPPAELASTEFRHFQENEMPIFHCAECENRRWSHGGGRRCFGSDRRWSWRRQTLPLRLSAYPMSGQQRRRRWRSRRSRDRHWRQRMSLSVRWPSEARERQTLSHICRSTDRRVCRGWAGGGSILDRVWRVTDAGTVSCLTLGVDRWISNEQWTRGDIWEWQTLGSHLSAWRQMRLSPPKLAQWIANG